MERKRPNPEETLAILRSKPGIDLTKQPPGTVLLVETTGAVYEITVLSGPEGMVKVLATDAHLKPALPGKFIQSVYDDDRRVAIPKWIGATMRMEMLFREMSFQSTAVTSAKISGDGWHYDVF